jgi:hypothetical protein
MEAIDIKVPRDLIQLLGLDDAEGLEKHSRQLLAVDLPNHRDKLNIVKIFFMDVNNAIQFFKKNFR